MLATTDLIADQRVHKMASCLQMAGWEVSLTGRELPSSCALPSRQYKASRLKLFFLKGPFFYAEYNIRSFFMLLRAKPRIIAANDLDTLPAAWAAAKLLRCGIVYDSHEYFTQVPELAGRPAARKIWELIESAIVPKLKHCITVSGSIAQEYQSSYGNSFHLVPNYPARLNIGIADMPDIPVILYQGALNPGRGLELLIMSMVHINSAKLVIAGSGPMLPLLKELAAKYKVESKLQFTGRIPMQLLHKYTQQAAIGVSLEEDLGLNYRYALPNKIFDYIQCHVPQIISNLPEMRAAVERFNTGRVLMHRTPSALAGLINKMLADNEALEEMKRNCCMASNMYSWDNLMPKIEQIYDSASRL
jgi:glycosyltransferase involved in cell wall biosynthesis